MPKIICAGLMAVDLVFHLAEMPAKGMKSRADNADMVTGGGAMNAASAMARLGGTVSLCGATGDDLFGTFLRSSMAQRGIDDRYVRILPDTATSGSAIILTPDGDRTIINHRADALGRGDCDLPPAFPFDGALVDTRFPDMSAQILTAATRAGKPAVIDAEAPVKPAQAALQSASHVVFSEQGLTDYCGSAGATALAEAAQHLGAWCAVTRGAQPVLCHDGTQVQQVPTLPVQAVNTLGAGDVWHGAFTLALAGGFSEMEAARRANATAALAVSRPVAEGALPTSDEVQAFIAQSAPDQP